MKLEYSGFEWDQGNAGKNLQKHEVSCEEAEEVFQEKPVVFPDERHSTEEEKRYILFGETMANRFLFVAFTIRDKKVRVISARPMSRKERGWYVQEKEKTEL